MTVKYSFSRVWKIAVGMIFAALFIMSAVGFIFAQQMHHEIKYTMAVQIEMLKLTTNVTDEISETSAEFGKLLIYQGQNTDVSECIGHLNKIREYLDYPIFDKAGQSEFRQILRKSELRLRTMLYAYKATNFSDPARDKAQESLQLIVNTIREARHLAITQCLQIQISISHATENLVKLTERARLCLYAAMATGLVFVVSTVVLLGKELRKRMQYIIAAADHIRDGNTAYRIRMPFEDEIGRVASRFDVMAEEIERKEMQLNNSNQILAEALDEAQHASVMKSQFLANISHEIRTPMNAILGFTGLLLEDQVSADQRRYLDIIQEASDNLMEIINSVLDFSKIEAGKMDIEKQNCAINDIIQYINSLMVVVAQKKHLVFQVYCRDGLPSVFKADPLRIRQCLINLVSNAIKFTEKGHVDLSISLEEHDDSQWMRFDVEDTGVGIARDKLDLIFEPFCQADGSTARQYGGTGLGLSITQKLAELMGGSVLVKSTVGVGSIFTLLLPISSVGESAIQEPASGETSGADEIAAAQNLDNASL